MPFLRSCLRLLPRIVTAALLALLFFLAAQARFRLPLMPLADPDIWCYFNPPLSRLLGGPFQHTYGQCFLYPGLLYVVLAAGGDFRWIGLVQHVFGLGTGALLLVAWRQVRAFLPAPRLPLFLYDLAGLAMAAFYLLASSTIRFEHTLRPEAVFPFFAVLNICANLAFIRRRFYLPGARERWRVLAGAVAVFACVTAWLLKPSFSVMLLLANLPVGLSLFLPGAGRRAKLTLALAPALAAGLLLILPEWRFRRADPDAHSFLAVSLFTVHADLVRDQMTDDLARRATAPYDPEWLTTVRDQLAAAIHESAAAGHYPSLGFNPDYVKLQTSFIGWLTRQESAFALAEDAADPHPRPENGAPAAWELRLRAEERTANFCDDYYRRAWRGRPLAMGRKIWRQLGVFYRFDTCLAYRLYRHLDLRAEYAESAVIFDPGGPLLDPRWPTPNSNLAKANRYPPARDYLARCAELSRTPHLLTSPRWVDEAANVLSLTYLPLCLGAFALGAACSVPVVRRWTGPAAGVLLFLYAYNFGTTLSLSIGHSMDIGRYSMYQLAFTLLPQWAGAWLGLEAALAVGARLARGAGAWFESRPAHWPGARLAARAVRLAVGRRRFARWGVRRPWQSLGAAAAVGMGLAAVCFAGAVHHPGHARHRYILRRVPTGAAVVLAAASLASAAAGGVLEARRRHWRKVFPLNAPPSR